MKHSIVVITYNQEKTIKDCLDSIFTQSTFPYEVIVSDDCSTDRTWEILQSYKRLYPDTLTLYQNEKNIGIFPHINKLKSYVSGDFVNLVAGDDMLPEGILTKYDLFIMNNHLNIQDSFIIYTNSLLLYPNGEQKMVSNYVNRNISPFDLTFSDAFYVWETGMSITLFKQSPEMKTDIGYQADWLFHIERLLKCEKYYFINVPGYIYRMNVGVTAASKALDLLKSKLQVISIFKDKHSNIISDNSRKVLTFYEMWIHYVNSPSLYSYLRMVMFFFRIQGILPCNAEMKGNYRVIIPISIKKIIKRLMK